MIIPIERNARGLLRLVTVVFITGVAASAPAAGEMPTEARQAMIKGLTAVKIQDYELAIKYFKEAQEAAPYEPEVLFSLALAYDKAGGRELLAIAWYRAFLGGFNSKKKQDIRDERFEKVRQRVIKLDIQVESAVRRLIKIAEETAQKLPLEDCNVYMWIAEAQAAVGDFDAARESLRLGFQKKKNLLYSDTSLVYSSEEITKPVINIVFSQWKHGDSKGAIKTINFAVSGSSCTSPSSGNRYNLVDRKELEPLRLFINREWSNHELSRKGFGFLSGIYFIGSSGHIENGEIEKFGGFGDSKRDELVRALYMYDDFFKHLTIMDKSYWVRDDTVTPPQVWETVISRVLSAKRGYRYLIINGFTLDQDWRVLTKKMKNDPPNRTVAGITELATEMAHVLLFFRKFNEYNRTVHKIWVW